VLCSVELIIKFLQERLNQASKEVQSNFMTAVVPFCRYICSEYPLLVPSPLLVSMIANTEEIPSFEQMKEILTEICAMKPRPFFHKILMHGELTADELKSKIDAIDTEAKKFPTIQFIVFFDELNTSSLLGLVLLFIFVLNSPLIHSLDQRNLY